MMRLSRPSDNDGLNATIMSESSSDDDNDRRDSSHAAFDNTRERSATYAGTRCLQLLGSLRNGSDAGRIKALKNFQDYVDRVGRMAGGRGGGGTEQLLLLLLPEEEVQLRFIQWLQQSASEEDLRERIERQRARREGGREGGLEGGKEEGG
ncbi:Hypothetical protein NocV09_03000520, partial [Nannochloropsis oceanica]